MSDDTLSNKQMDEAVEAEYQHTQAILAARRAARPTNIKVSIRQGTSTIFSNVYPVSEEGDIEGAITDARQEARRLVGGPLWDFDMKVEKA